MTVIAKFEESEFRAFFKLSTEAIISALHNTFQPLCKLTEPRLPVNYPRERGYRPAPEENPCNAW